MDALFLSTGTVAVAEIGDKTQLLAFLLAARFRRPLPIVLGIFVATVANHAFAAAVGALVSELLGPGVMRWVLGLSFLGMAAWVLTPDEIDAEEAQLAKYGVFLTTLIAFFLAEMGDKTQVATVMLAAQYPHFILVVIGTTLGMLIANVPVVLAGNFAAERLPLTLIRRIAACAFALLALYAGYQALSLAGLV